MKPEMEACLLPPCLAHVFKINLKKGAGSGGWESDAEALPAGMGQNSFIMTLSILKGFPAILSPVFFCPREEL